MPTYTKLERAGEPVQMVWDWWTECALEACIRIEDGVDPKAYFEGNAERSPGQTDLHQRGAYTFRDEHVLLDRPQGRTLIVHAGDVYRMWYQPR